jgi:predicted TIM-barrel fold metal-dependent hydrolase
MLIVDAQVHIWSSGTPLPPHRPTSVFTKDELLEEMDAAGVDAAVIHPPGWDPNSGAVALEAARQHPTRLAILGKIPLERPNPALLDDLKRQPGMLGLRFTFLQPHQKTWPTDGTMDWLWPAAERAEVPIGLLAAEFLPLVGQIAGRHPRLKLIIDHLGRPSRTRDEAAWGNLDELLALAKHPNIAVKATGAPSYTSESYPFRSLQPHLRRLYDAFGPERLFWGTDITRMPCTWRQCVTHFTEELPWLTERDKELIMGRALCTWLGWKL